MLKHTFEGAVQQRLAEYMTVVLVLGVVGLVLLAVPALGVVMVLDQPTRSDCAP